MYYYKTKQGDVIKMDTYFVNKIQSICNIDMEPVDKLSKKDIALAIKRDKNYFDCL